MDRILGNMIFFEETKFGKSALSSVAFTYWIIAYFEGKKGKRQKQHVHHFETKPSFSVKEFWTRSRSRLFRTEDYLSEAKILSPP